MNRELLLNLFVIAIVSLFMTAHGALQRMQDLTADALFTYGMRLEAGLWDYAAANTSTLRQTPTAILPADVLSGTRAGATIVGNAPNGQPARFYSYGNGRVATLYAVIPTGGKWPLVGTGVYLQAANRLSVRAGTVEGNAIVSRGGGWRVPISSLPSFVAADGDIVIRVQSIPRAL